jgi:hypothetical protein
MTNLLPADPFDRLLARGIREAPAKGWVRPDDPPVYCDACNQRCWYWELHHLDPIGWGGSPSRLLADRQIVWIRVDGNCHGVGHMILDAGKANGSWPQAWLDSFADPLPHPMVEVARRGWQLYQRRLSLQLTAETVARGFHERYEELAPSFGSETREDSAVPWHRVPEANRRLMIATAERVLADFDLRQHREET